MLSLSVYHGCSDPLVSMRLAWWRWPQGMVGAILHLVELRLNCVSRACFVARLVKIFMRLAGSI